MRVRFLRDLPNMLSKDTQKRLEALSLKDFKEFLRIGDTTIHHFGWKNVIRELIRRLEHR